MYILGVSGKALGGKPTKTSTHPITLRGQDKKMQPVLGMNPNKNIEDEYIHNLQQQMHFMEMELKLLKEKVIEDEKNSGIGSLFNDEKTSLEHIDILKQKYNQMRRDYLKKTNDTDKERLKILGEQFVLDAQINILTDINNKMEDVRDRDEKRRLEQISDLEKKYRELYNERKRLEAELAKLKDNVNREQKKFQELQDAIKKEEEADAHGTYRFERDSAAGDAMHAKKQEELEQIKADLEGVAQQFASNPEYVENEESINKNIEDAKTMYVELQLMKCQVRELEQAKELYEKIKEDETQRKRDLIERNSELKKEVESKEQMERMRMQKRLNETKNPELKEVMLNSTMVSENIEGLEGKVSDEKDKYDDLLNEKLVLDRITEEMKNNLDKNTATVEQQDGDIGELKTVTDELDKEVKDLNNQNTDAIALNKEVENKYRRLAKTNLALQAKLEFLFKNYDFSSNVKGLRLEDFRNLVMSNEKVNENVSSFTDKLAKTKEDVMRFEIDIEAKGGML